MANVVVACGSGHANQNATLYLEVLDANGNAISVITSSRRGIIK